MSAGAPSTHFRTRKSVGHREVAESLLSGVKARDPFVGGNPKLPAIIFQHAAESVPGKPIMPREGFDVSTSRIESVEAVLRAQPKHAIARHVYGVYFIVADSLRVVFRVGIRGERSRPRIEPLEPRHGTPEPYVLIWTFDDREVLQFAVSRVGTEDRKSLGCGIKAAQAVPRRHPQRSFVIDQETACNVAA